MCDDDFISVLCITITFLDYIMLFVPQLPPTIAAALRITIRYGRQERREDLGVGGGLNWKADDLNYSRTLDNNVRPLLIII